MSRFDVYPTSGTGRTEYVLDVQTGFLEALGTRVVVPLRTAEQAPMPARGLDPIFDIDGRPL